MVRYPQSLYSPWREWIFKNRQFWQNKSCCMYGNDEEYTPLTWSPCSHLWFTALRRGATLKYWKLICPQSQDLWDWRRLSRSQPRVGATRGVAPTRVRRRATVVPHRDRRTDLFCRCRFCSSSSRADSDRPRWDSRPAGSPDTPLHGSAGSRCCSGTLGPVMEQLQCKTNTPSVCGLFPHVNLFFSWVIMWSGDMIWRSIDQGTE